MTFEMETLVETRRNALSLDSMPLDVLRKVVTHMTLRDWGKLSGTCRAFRELQLGLAFDQVFLPYRACTVPGAC